jgi:hypothetical protein
MPEIFSIYNCGTSHNRQNLDETSWGPRIESSCILSDEWRICQSAAR